MTPTEARAAIQSLGLLQKQLAGVMGVKRETVARWSSGAITPPPTAARLLQAYLDGYRPADWPTTTQETTDMQNYIFYDRHRDESTGEWVYDEIALHRCDSDAQAELMVNHIRDDGLIPTDLDGKPKRGLTIRRARDWKEWYSTGV